MFFLTCVGNKKKKMFLSKILMCECYVDQFQSEGNEYVKKLTHFHCKCKDEHLLYILFCENYPYGHTPVLEDKKCTCATICATDVCNFCIHVKYLLNFKCYKYCVEKIPENILDELIIINEYLEIIKSCEPFFHFNR